MTPVPAFAILDRCQPTQGANVMATTDKSAQRSYTEWPTPQMGRLRSDHSVPMVQIAELQLLDIMIRAVD